MISGKPFFLNHRSSEGKRKYSRANRQPHAHVWHGRHEPSASRTNCKWAGRVSRRVVILFQEGKATTLAEGQRPPSRGSERGKEKEKKQKNIPNWFHDSYWFRRSQFNHGSVVAECPSRQREEALRFSPGSESAVAAAMSQGRVTEGKRTQIMKNTSGFT